MPDHSIIVSALEHFLDTHRIKHVHFAHGKTPPPMLAYVVNFPRLTVPLEGTDNMEIERQGRPVEFELTPGQALFVPPNCWNRPVWNKPVKVMAFLFGKRQTGISLVDHDGLSNEPRRAYKAGFPAMVEGPAQKIIHALQELETQAEREPVDALLVQALCHYCLKQLRNINHQPVSKSRKLFENICMYIQESYQNPINRDSVAHHFQISPGHLSRLFKTESSMTFSEYLTLVRIDRAKFMLKNYDLTLNEISSGCGYSETAYFCRVFKKYTKVTPSSYRLKSL